VKEGGAKQRNQEEARTEKRRSRHSAKKREEKGKPIAVRGG